MRAPALPSVQSAFARRPIGFHDLACVRDGPRFQCFPQRVDRLGFSRRNESAFRSRAWTSRKKNFFSESPSALPMFAMFES